MGSFLVDEMISNEMTHDMMSWLKSNVITWRAPKSKSWFSYIEMITLTTVNSWTNNSFLLQCYRERCDRSLHKANNVLFTVAYSCAFDAETFQSCPSTDTRYVYGTVLDRVLPGKKTLHRLQPGIPSDSISDLLQRTRQLFSMGFTLWWRRWIAHSAFVMNWIYNILKLGMKYSLLQRTVMGCYIVAYSLEL